MKRVITFCLAIIMVLALSISVSAKSFSDCEGHWAAAEIDRITELGLFNGVSATEFAPQNSMTRAMFVTVLGRAAEKLGLSVEAQEASAFVDVAKGQYYASYVQWAKETGIVNGVDATHFAPNNSITRQDMCVIYVRFLNWAGYDLSSFVEGELKFTDSEKIGAYAKEAVGIASNMGLVTGVANKAGLGFNPQDLANRAAVAIVTARLMDKVADLPLAEGKEEGKLPSGGIGGAGGGAVGGEQADIRARLQAILDQYNDVSNPDNLTIEYLANCTPDEKTLIADVMSTVEKAMASGMPLSKENIRADYPAEVSSVKERYMKLNDAATGRVSKVLLSFGDENVKVLRNFFGI